MITFFVGLAKHELFLLNLLPTLVELDKGNQSAYSKEINMLLERAELEDEEELEEEADSVSEETS